MDRKESDRFVRDRAHGAFFSSLDVAVTTISVLLGDFFFFAGMNTMLSLTLSS